ncbi:MAG: ATP-binding protein [Candidatus Omnitrophica bacterium]|nr:ATP-binding protein [Candidatus Omnitrophota bacterium]
MLSEPAVDKAFFGREKILGILEKRVNALKGGYRQNVALTGQMLAGKSSILHQFLHTLKDRSLIPIYIEVVEEPFSSFVDKFIATLLYNYLISLELEAEKDLSNLMEKAEPLIPHTTLAIKKVKSELSRKNYNDAYRKLLNLTSTLKEETGKSCVVILDEFHNLEFLKIKKPYLHFGKIMMIQKDTMYIVSSSQKNTIKKILSEKLALLYGNFEIIEVSGFDNKTARAFLEEKLQSCTIGQGHLEYLIDFTDRNPFYLDAISKKIAEIANSRRLISIGEDVIIEAFTSLMYNTNGTINQYFTNNIMNLFEKGLREDYLDVLIAVACGFNTLKDIARWFDKKNPGGFTRKTSHLAELDIVYKNGVFYEVFDKVFKFWLKTVYHKKKTSLVDDIVSRTNDFKEDVKDDIDEYLTERQKDITEHIKELLLLFNGEVVEIEKRHRKLPRFVNVESEKREKCVDLVACQLSHKYWVFQVGRDKTDELAILNFIERYYPMRDKVAKKICVALGGIDSNALLLAKERNIWVWNLENINAILRLYKKHDLICR